MHARASLVIGLVAVLTGSAAAQVLEPPPRSVGGLFGGRRPLDPGRVRQELTLTVHALGGYDDNLSLEGQPVLTDPFHPPQSGYTGVGSATVRYWRGRSARYLEAAGRTHVTSYSGISANALLGGDASLLAATDLSRRTSLNGAFRTDYRPTFTLGAFGPLADQLEEGVVPETNPTGGVSELRSLSTSALVVLERRWSARHRSSVGYDFANRQFTNATGLDNRSHALALAHNWSLARPTSVRLAYRHTSQTTDRREAGALATRSDAADVGFEVRKRMSPTRTMMFMAGGGATGVRTVSVVTGEPFEYVVPSAFASTRVDIGRSWAFSADVRRDATVIESLTRHSFVTYVASARAGGQIGSRLAAAVSAAFAKGEPPAGQTGSFESVTGSGQLDYTISRWCSLVTSYSYYDHRLRDVSVPEGFPMRFERNSVRVGFTITLPLYGTFQSSRRGPGVRN